VAERHLFEDGALVGPQGDPDLLKGLGRPGVLDVLRPLAADAEQRTVDGADDLGQRDLAGGPGQPEAALRSPLAADQARPPELRQDRLQELARNLLRARDPIRRHVAVGSGGEFDCRAQRVVGAG